MSAWSEKLFEFHASLKIENSLPRGIDVLNPYHGYALDLCRQFFDAFYNDRSSRTLLLGINPGRFGSGTTGISFTDPVRLQEDCGIVNSLPKKKELSSDFIYRMIAAYGGVYSFHSRFLISAVSPLGFVKDGKNINYYDAPRLQKAVTPFIVKAINELVNMGVSTSHCFCIGEGKNYQFVSELNKQHGWFHRIVPLPHPRFIMQYKRKELTAYIQKYVDALATTA